MYRLKKISKGIAYIMNRAIVLVFALMLSLVLVQVLFRYVFHLPIPWAEELARYLFTWLIFLAAGMVSKKEEHMAITTFQEMLPLKFRKVLLLIIDLIIFYFLFILTVNSIDLVKQVSKTASPVLQVSMAFPYLSVTIGGFTMMFYTLLHIIKKIIDIHNLWNIRSSEKDV